MKSNTPILKSLLNECSKHAFWMNSAYRKLQSSLPITPDRVFKLDDQEVEHIDQYIFRFSKLQDAIGNKLFKSVLTELGEEVTDKSAIDIFNRMEQLGIIENYEVWKEFRDIRNELAYDYEEDEHEAAEKINLIISKKSDLEKYLNDIVNYLNTKKLI
ncbi:MAG: hypothetical protein Q8N83_14580 [Ignavibacteria bacterium]|nr:hypothetical protein [Ignavibacteria bacterium]